MQWDLSFYHLFVHPPNQELGFSFCPDIFLKQFSFVISGCAGFPLLLRLALVVGLVGHTPVAVCVLLIVADSLVEKYGV